MISKENFCMQDSINLKVISSEKEIANLVASYVFVPNDSGILKILPSHCNYTGILTKGKIVYKAKDNEEESNIDINGGVCSFIDDNLEVLVDL